MTKLQTARRHIRRAERKTFEYGKFDCCSFVVAYLSDRITNDIYPEQRRDRIRSVRRVRAILDMGGGLRRMAIRRMNKLGVERLKSPLFAERGDIAVVETVNGDTAGIVMGMRVIAVGVRGVQMLSIHDAVVAWRVP